MKKGVLMLCVLLTVSIGAAWGMGEKPKGEPPAATATAGDANTLLARIETRLKAENVLSAEELSRLMTALRVEFEARKNISLKAYTLEQRTRLMLQEGPIVDSIKLTAKNRLKTEEQARIALASSIAVARGANQNQVSEMAQLMLQNRVSARICQQVIDGAGEEASRNREMTQTRMMVQEMTKLNLKGESLALALKEMNQMMAAGETPRQARLKVMEQVKIMLKDGKNESQICDQMQIRIRERTRMMEGAGEGMMKKEMKREETEGGGTGGAKSGGEGKKTR